MENRPSGVPEQATFNEADREWELGQRRGKRTVGEWTWWRPDGSMVGKSTFDEAGKLHGMARRFHPDGEVSLESRYVHGNRWGKTWHTRSRGGDSPEDNGAAGLPAAVQRFEMVYMNGMLIPGMTTGINAAGRDEPPEHRFGNLVNPERDLRKYLPGTAFTVFGGLTDIAGQVHDARIVYFDGPAYEDYSVLRFAFGPPGSHKGDVPKWQDPTYGTAVAIAEFGYRFFVAVDVMDALIVEDKMPPRWGLKMAFADGEVRCNGAEPGGLVEKADLRAGDMFVEINGVRVSSPVTYMEGMHAANERRELALTVRRDGALRTVIVKA